MLPVGSTALAFPAETLGRLEDVRLRWGFGGWRRRAGVEVPGHDVARSLGFGALADRRAALALADGLVLVDPESGEVVRVPYPNGARHEAGREFMTAPLSRDATIVRGAGGAAGGWVAQLSSANAWSEIAPGPAAGTIATDPVGGFAWLLGSELHHRDASGAESAPRVLDAAGRLLAVDVAGRAWVRTAGGSVVCADPGDGRVLERIEGVTVGVDPSGAAWIRNGFDRRHAELATSVRLVRVAPGGGRSDCSRSNRRTDPDRGCGAAGRIDARPRGLLVAPCTRSRLVGRIRRTLELAHRRDAAH
jgi:hypothetical protein